MVQTGATLSPQHSELKKQFLLISASLELPPVLHIYCTLNTSKPEQYYASAGFMLKSMMLEMAKLS